MSTPDHPNLHDLTYVSVSLFLLAVVITSFRLFLRLKRDHWWWDDTFALLGVAVMSLYVIGTAMLIDKARSVQILAYYFLTPGFYVPIWSARLSILFTTIRITPWARHRKVLLCFAILFVIQCLALHVQLFWRCEISHPEWKTETDAFCDLGDAVAITQVTTSLISDLILIIAPLWILRTVLADSRLRLRLVSVFSISVVTTLAAFVHSFLLIVDPGVTEGISAALEVAVALIVCNVSVVIPVILRCFSNRDAHIGSHRRVSEGFRRPIIDTFRSTDPIAVVFCRAVDQVPGSTSRGEHDPPGLCDIELGELDIDSGQAKLQHNTSTDAAV